MAGAIRLGESAWMRAAGSAATSPSITARRAGRGQLRQVSAGLHAGIRFLKGRSEVTDGSSPATGDHENTETGAFRNLSFAHSVN